MPIDTNNSAGSRRPVSVVYRSSVEGGTAKRLRWGALPFLVAAFIQGLPISRELEVSETKWAEVLYEETQARATTLGFENSITLTLVWGALYLLATGMLVRVARPAISALWRYWPLLLMVALMAASLLWVSYPGKVAVNIGHNLGVFAIAISAAFYYREDPRMLPVHLGLVLGLNIALHLAAVLMMPSLAIGLDDRWRGLSTHPNILGMIAFCAVWANGTALVSIAKAKRNIHFGFLVLAVITLLGSQSVTSIISAAVALGGVYFLSRGNKHINRSASPIGRLWLMTFVISVLSILLIGFAIGKQGLFELLGRSQDLSGRFDIWLEAIDVIADRPLFGWGFDENASVNQVTGLPHANYHNGYLDLAVRGGIFSVAVLFLLLALSLRLTKRTAGSAWCPIFMSLLISMLVYNISEVTFFAPRNLIWIAFLALLFIAAVYKIAESGKERYVNR